MTELVTKCVEVTTINDIADIIWGMDCKEQAKLLQLLACRFDTPDCYTQMLNTSTEVVEQGYPNTVGNFVDRLHGYLGWEHLNHIKNSKKNWGNK